MSEEPEATNSEKGVLSVIGDALGNLVTGIPAPIRKNALKAFAQLFTAAVEYPVVLLQGAAAEQRAASEARVKLINTSARQITKQMQTNPEYARAAVRKFGQKILRERVNIDQIFLIAAEELKSVPIEAPTQTESEVPPPISEDWLNAFETEAAQISTEQMQRLFGKILAGEIRRPASYSIKTLKLMAQIDNRAAALFSVLCSLSVSLRDCGRPEVLDKHIKPQIPNLIYDARVVSLGRDAGRNRLAPYGLGFDALNILQEYGLIAADVQTYMEYSSAFLREGNTVTHLMVYQNAPWVLIPKVETTISPELRLAGVAFTLAGREMLPIVEITPNEQYTAALIDYFDQQGITMTRAAAPFVSLPAVSEG